jgi:membrane protein YdbS with pleckstrin-like domain
MPGAPLGARGGARYDARVTTTRRFPSAVSPLLALMIFGTLGASVTVAGYELLMHGRSAERILVVVVMAIALAFSTWLFIATDYEVTETELLVRSGPLRRTIPLASIVYVRPTMNPLSAPALSFRRIEIGGASGLLTLISPRDRSGFVAALAERVPGLEVRR